jgi:hypothetical protein
VAQYENEKGMKKIKRKFLSGVSPSRDLRYPITTYVGYMLQLLRTTRGRKSFDIRFGWKVCADV